MLDFNEIVKTFKGTAGILPLPDFVMFPKTSYSFNIFEPKYRQLMDHILSGDKFFCLTLLKEQGSNQISKFNKFGTLAYVIDYKKKTNGDYNIIVSGINKVSIKEIESENLYRMGALELLNDNDVIIEEHLKRKKLINKFIQLVGSENMEFADVKSLDLSFISTEILTNLACLVLPLSSNNKQKLLELNDINLRLDILCQFMDSELKLESDLLNFNQVIPLNIKWN